MNKEILKKIKRPLIQINLNNKNFDLKRNSLNKKENIFYFYDEFYDLEKFFIENKKLNAIKIGLSFYLQSEKLGVSLFAHFFKKNCHVFSLETIKKNNFNLKVKYYKINNILNHNSLVLLCRFFENDRAKREEKVKIYW